MQVHYGSIMVKPVAARLWPRAPVERGSLESLDSLDPYSLFHLSSAFYRDHHDHVDLLLDVAQLLCAHED